MVASHITAHDLVPKYMSDNWPDSIPMQTIVIMAGLRPDGAHGLHAVHNTDAPIWVLIGMLRAVLADLEHTWADASWITNDDEDEEDES